MVFGMDKGFSAIVLAAILGALIGLLYGETLNLVDYGPWPRIGALLFAIVIVLIVVALNEKE